MSEITSEKLKKRAEKIFSKCRKPDGSGVLVLHIIDVLLASGKYMTVKEIQLSILNTKGKYYQIHPIYKAVETLNQHFHSGVVRSITDKHGKYGRARVKKISITINTEKNVQS